MLMTFEKIPTTYEEFVSLEYAKLDKPEYAAGLFLLAVCVYPKDKELAHKMIDFLKGPEPMNNYDKQFLRDRMMDKDYIGYSYFVGSSPQNNYQPNIPYTVEIMPDRSGYSEQGYAKFFIKSSGADMPRPIKMRLKPSTGQWFLYEQMLLAGIVIPVASDPWA